VRGTLLDVYLGNADLSEVTCTTNLAKVSIVPSNKSLAQANSQNPPVSEHVLLDALEEDVERNGDEVANDLEVIDTTPALSTLMVTSLVLATHVAIPMNLGELDLEGLRELRDLVATVQRRANPNLKIIAVIITRDQPNTLLARELRQTLAEELPGVLIAPIPSSVRIMEMAGYQESVFTVDAKGSGALASWRLAAHLAEAMGCTWEVAPEDVVSKDKVKKA
jgi:chromosome partitioning protein